MNVEEDPVDVIMNCDQKQISDNSFKLSKNEYEISSKRGQTNLYQISEITLTLPNVVSMDSLVLSVPLVIFQHSNTLLTNIQKLAMIPRMLNSNMGIMNAFWKIKIFINDESVDNDESSKTHVMKQTMIDYKFDDDSYSWIGCWGVPFTQTIVTNEADQIENLAWRQNPVGWRDKYYNILQSCLTINNGNKYGEPYLITNGTGTIATIDQTATSFVLPLPLYSICRAFRSKARLPLGTKITIQFQTLKFQQPFSVMSNTFSLLNYNMYTAWINPTLTIKLNYVYDELNPEVESAINMFRGSQFCTYNNSVIEEFLFPGGTGPVFMRNITNQQQLPSQLSFSIVNYNTNCAIYKPPLVTDPLGSYPILIITNWVQFAESDGFISNSIITNNLKDFGNFIKELQIWTSGKLIYKLESEDSNTSLGNQNPSANDVIFKNYYQKNSFLNLTQMNTLVGPMKSFTNKIVNGNYRIIMQPGGEIQEGEVPKPEDATNIKIQLIIKETMDENTYLSILRQIPTQLTISATNTTRVRKWPNLEENGILKVIHPKLAN